MDKSMTLSELNQKPLRDNILSCEGEVLSKINKYKKLMLFFSDEEDLIASNLRYIHYLLSFETVKRFIILAEGTSSNRNWEHGIQNSKQLSSILKSINFTTGINVDSEKKLLQEHQLIICNYDSLGWLFDKLKDEISNYNMVIEASALSNNNEKNITYQEISVVTRDMRYVLLSSINRSVNNVNLIYHYYSFFDGGKLLRPLFERHRLKFEKSKFEKSKLLGGILNFEAKIDNKEGSIYNFIPSHLFLDEFRATVEYCTYEVLSGYHSRNQRPAHRDIGKFADVSTICDIIKYVEGIISTFQRQSFLICYKTRSDADIILKNTDINQISRQNVKDWNDGNINRMLMYGGMFLSNFSLSSYGRLIKRCPDNIIWINEKSDANLEIVNQFFNVRNQAKPVCVYKLFNNGDVEHSYYGKDHNGESIIYDIDIGPLGVGNNVESIVDLGILS